MSFTRAWLAALVFAVGCAPAQSWEPEAARARVDELAPPNDRCSSPTPLQLGVSVAGTTLEANDDVRCGYRFLGPDVVYSFTPTTTGAYRAVVTSQTGGADGGGVSVYVRSDCADAGACAAPPSGSSITFRATAGTTSLLVVDSEWWELPGDFTLITSPITPPANDTCANPAVLSLNTTVTADLTSALDDTLGGLDGGCGTAGYPDLMFRFTAPTTGR
jgi:hypothetical protein